MAGQECPSYNLRASPLSRTVGGASATSPLARTASGSASFYPHPRGTSPDSFKSDRVIRISDCNLVGAATRGVGVSNSATKGGCGRERSTRFLETDHSPAVA